MRRLAMALPTLAMLLCLTAYGLDIHRESQRQSAPRRSDQLLQSLKPMGNSAMPQPLAESVRNRQRAVGHAARVQEDLIIAQLGLTAVQMAVYAQLRQSNDQQIPPEDPAEAALFALRNSAKYRVALQEILTPDQYCQYLEVWSHHQGVYGSVKPDGGINVDEDVVSEPADAAKPPK